MNKDLVWDKAHNYANSFGTYTPALTTTIRALLADHKVFLETGENTLSHTTLFNVKRLVKCPSIMAHFYFITKTCHAEKLNEKKTPLDLIKLYTPQELAAVLSVIYVSRRLAQRCDSTQWIIIMKTMQTYADMGLLIGRVIPNIGIACGLLTAVCRFFAWGSLAIQDPDGLKKYRIGLRADNIPFSLKQEAARWETTHVHIATLILQNLGFGKDYANSYFAGVSDMNLALLDEQAMKFRIASLWIESLMHTGEAPEETIGDEFILDEDLENDFSERVSSLLSYGSLFNWLQKTKDDINSEATPELDFNYAIKDTLKVMGEEALEEE